MASKDNHILLRISTEDKELIQDAAKKVDKNGSASNYIVETMVKKAKKDINKGK